MNNKYKSWCKWHPLKTVMLGRSYYPAFYRDIKNSKIRDSLIRIAEETEEDFQHFHKVLKDYGCEVIRPDIKEDDSMMNYLNDEGKIRSLMRPPAQPRDGQFLLGEKLVFTRKDHPSIRRGLLEYNSEDTVDTPLCIEGRLKEKFDAPMFTVIGKDVYIDTGGDDYMSPRKKAHCVPSAPYREKEIQWFKDNFPDNKFSELQMGSHNDGIFHTLKPGALITVRDLHKYEQTFPGWDVCELPEQSWAAVAGFRKLKNKNKGTWWVPGEEDNDELIEFIDTWLNEWVGFVEETVFDVNILMLDDKTACVSNYNKKCFDFFKKHDIEPIVVPFRHRYFWDGGLHCITLDLYREGEMEDFFPARKEGVIFETRSRYENK